MADLVRIKTTVVAVRELPPSTILSPLSLYASTFSQSHRAGVKSFLVNMCLNAMKLIAQNYS